MFVVKKNSFYVFKLASYSVMWVEEKDIAQSFESLAEAKLVADRVEGTVEV